MDPSKLDYALAYARRGLKVFRLRPHDTRPLAAGWQGEATTDEATIKRWWRENPDLNIGVAGDGRHGYLDVDVKNGYQGDKTLAALQAEHGALPPTFTVQTPSGGFHYYFETDTPFGNYHERVGAGLDTRGPGGYVVGAGSTTEKGVYTRVKTDAPATFAPAPSWLARKAARRELEKTAQNNTAFEWDEQHAVARAAEYLAGIEPAIEGQGGDTHTVRAAMKLRDFGVSEGMALSLMSGPLFNARCIPPWPLDGPQSLSTKISSAYRSAQNPPGIAGSAETEFEATDPPLPQFGFPPVDFTRMRSLRARPWIVKGLAVAGKLSLIIAPPGAGKSSLTLALAVSVACGRDLLGLGIVRYGTVVVWNNEDEMDELLARVRAIIEHYRLTGDEVSKVSKHLRLQAVDHLAFRIEKHRDQAVQLLRETEAVMFIVDPLSETHGAEENSNDEMLAVMADYRTVAIRARTAVVLVHHTRKPPSGSSESHAGNMDSGRGAGAITQPVRFAKTLYSLDEKMAEELGLQEEERVDYVRFDDAKVSLGRRSPEPLILKRVSVEIDTLEGIPEEIGVIERVGHLREQKRRHANTERVDIANDIVQHATDGETLRSWALKVAGTGMYAVSAKRVMERAQKLLDEPVAVAGRSVSVENAGTKGGKSRWVVRIVEDFEADQDEADEGENEAEKGV